MGAVAGVVHLLPGRVVVLRGVVAHQEEQVVPVVQALVAVDQRLDQVRPQPQALHRAAVLLQEVLHRLQAVVPAPAVLVLVQQAVAVHPVVEVHHQALRVVLRQARHQAVPPQVPVVVPAHQGVVLARLPVAQHRQEVPVAVPPAAVARAVAQHRQEVPVVPVHQGVVLARLLVAKHRQGLLPVLTHLVQHQVVQHQVVQHQAPVAVRVVPVALAVVVPHQDHLAAGHLQDLHQAVPAVVQDLLVVPPVGVLHRPVVVAPAPHPVVGHPLVVVLLGLLVALVPVEAVMLVANMVQANKMEAVVVYLKM